MDHLAEDAENSALTCQPQVAPRSSTLPRRTKLSEFLAETANEEQKTVLKSRRRRRSPRKGAERLKSTGDILHVVEPGNHQKKEDSPGSHGGVASERGSGTPSHAESLAQRHVRERLEARARHSSSRTSSGSSLERSDTSPATSLERGAKLELPRQPEDVTRSGGDQRGSSRGDTSRNSSSRQESSLPESTDDSRVSARPSNESPSRRKEHKSPGRGRGDHKLKVVDSKLKVIDQNHARSHRESNAHESKRDGSSPHETTRHEIHSHEAGLYEPNPREPDSGANSRVAHGSPKHELDTNRGIERHVVRSNGELKHPKHDPNQEKSRVVDKKEAPRQLQNGGHGEIRRNHRYVNEDSAARSSVWRKLEQSQRREASQPSAKLSHVENREYFDVYNGEMDEEVSGVPARRGNDEPVYQNIGVLVTEEAIPVPVAKQRRSTQNSEEGGKSKEPHRNEESSKTRQNGEGLSPKHRRDRSSPRHHRERDTSSPKTHKVRTDTIPTTDVNKPPSDVNSADIISELRAANARKDQNTAAALQALERKQMNNEKVLEAISPSRPERLSVKNIFHELSTPAKVPPKSLPDGISPDQRLTRPLTYHDLVKSPPAKMADTSPTTSKMAGAAPASNKMADAAETNPAQTTTESAAKRATSPGDASLRTYPSLSSLNLNFKSLAAQRLLHGASANSIDTLVEVNLAAERRRSAGGTETTLLGIL